MLNGQLDDQEGEQPDEQGPMSIPILRVKRKRTTPVARELGIGSACWSARLTCSAWRTRTLRRPMPAVAEGLVPHQNKRQAILAYFSHMDIAASAAEAAATASQVFQHVKSHPTDILGENSQYEQLMQDIMAQHNR